MSYKRSYKRPFISRDKYSIEQQAGTITAEGSDAAVSVVPSTDVKGMRKVKHLTIQMANTTETTPPVLYWAIVYVPEGTSPNSIVATGSSMYEPNQYVMSCGVFDFNAGPLRVSSPLARNLNAGDQIALVIKSTISNASFKFVVRYAITLQ